MFSTSRPEACGREVLHEKLNRINGIVEFYSRQSQASRRLRITQITLPEFSAIRLPRCLLIECSYLLSYYSFTPRRSAGRAKSSQGTHSHNLLGRYNPLHRNGFPGLL